MWLLSRKNVDMDVNVLLGQSSKTPSSCSDYSII